MTLVGRVTSLLVAASSLSACQAVNIVVNAFKSGAPPKAERRRIEARGSQMMRELSSKRLVVLPFAGVSGQPIVYDSAAAAALVAKLNADGTTHATLGGAIPLPFAGSSNELAILWSRLRALSAQVTAHPVDSADYVLMVDVLGGDGRIGAVHAMAVNAKGEMTFLVLWNSYQELYKQVQPKTQADVARMVAIGLARRAAEAVTAGEASRR